jgi:phage terminase small subunit
MRLPTADIDEERKLMILARDAGKAFSEIAIKFGMTPCDRAKLQLQPPGEEKTDPLLAMLKRRSNN